MLLGEPLGLEDTDRLRGGVPELGPSVGSGDGSGVDMIVTFVEVVLFLSK